MGFSHTHHEAVFCYTGVINKDIDTAKIIMDFFHHLLCLCKVGSIGCVSFYFHSESSDFFLSLGAVFVNNKVGEGDVGTFFSKAERYFLTDAAGSAGDKRGFSFE